MKKSVVLLIHAAFWLGNLFLLLLILGLLCQGQIVDEKEGIYFLKVAIGIVAVPAVFTFYCFYFFLFPKYLQHRKTSQSIIWSLLIACGAVIMSMIALYFLLEFTLSCYKISNYIAPPIMASIGLVYGVIAVVIRGFITWYEDIKIKKALQEKNHEMEMALVKAQLDPHFLFNTINNIDVLILKDAENASNYLNKLSDIMRFMLFETKADEIPLAKEIEYIEKYIELQKIRTANANFVKYSINGIVNQRSIAPMIFIPFIENAFKHSSNKKIENAIQVAITIGNNKIELLCENKYDPHRKKRDQNNGLGNDLIKKRLNLIYPDRYTLSVSEKEDTYSVHLIIENE